MKTGFTTKSGEDLAAAARRGGRTLIAVELDAPVDYIAQGPGRPTGGIAAARGQPNLVAATARDGRPTGYRLEPQQLRTHHQLS
jgi:hypothetical protein